MKGLWFQQRGVALISVLLIFALITIISGAMLKQSYLNTKRLSHYLNTHQAYYYALAAEQLARQYLYRDIQEESRAKEAVHYDSFDDEWAQQLEAFSIDEGSLEIIITDLQAKLNLNDLFDSESNQLRSAHVEVFTRLLLREGMPQGYRDVILDWLDSDNELRPQGAENDYYQSLKTPFVSAGRDFVDLSELLLLKGVSHQDVLALSQAITLLPEATPINMNTASKQLLGVLSDSMTNRDVNAVLTDQRAGGFDTVEQWLQQSYGASLAASGLSFAVASSYFEVRIKSVYDGRLCRLTTVFYRNPENGELQVVKRQRDAL